jgi:hypothetical protein
VPGLHRATIPAVTVSRARLIVVALFVALLAGACGNDSDTTGAQAKYIAQVDPICADLQTKVHDLGSNPEQQAKDVEDAVNRIKSVQKPRDNSERADVYIAAMQNLYLALQDVDQSRRVNDQARAQRALDTARTNDQAAAKAAKEYGMVVCAKEL